MLPHCVAVGGAGTSSRKATARFLSAAGRQIHAEKPQCRARPLATLARTPRHTSARNPRGATDPPTVPRAPSPPAETPHRAQGRRSPHEQMPQKSQRARDTARRGRVGARGMRNCSRHPPPTSGHVAVDAAIGERRRRRHEVRIGSSHPPRISPCTATHMHTRACKRLRSQAVSGGAFLFPELLFRQR